MPKYSQKGKERGSLSKTHAENESVRIRWLRYRTHLIHL